MPERLRQAWAMHGPAWIQHGGLSATIFFLLTILLLPGLFVVPHVYEQVVVPSTEFISTYFTPPPPKPHPDIYLWVLSGLLINATSILFAMGGIYRQRITDKFDVTFMGIYVLVLIFSVALFIFFRWAVEGIVYVLGTYYLVYVFTDLWGATKNWPSRYDRARYIYPLVCLDLPAFFAFIVIASTRIDGEFIEGMAAGHLVFGSFVYFGIASILLPFVLERIQRSENALESLRRAEAAMGLPSADEVVGHLKEAQAALTADGNLVRVGSPAMAQASIYEPRTVAIILMCAALNAGLAFLVQTFKLPIYLDLTGSVLCVLLLGLWPGLISAALGILVIGTLTVPTNFAYIGTALGVTALAWYLLRFGYLRRLFPTLWGGVALGLLSAVMSAPVTAMVFGGVSLVGADAVTALIRATGANIMTSVFLGGIATDPVDKVLASLIAFSIYKSMPDTLRNRPSEVAESEAQ